MYTVQIITKKHSHQWYNCVKELKIKLWYAYLWLTATNYANHKLSDLENTSTSVLRGSRRILCAFVRMTAYRLSRLMKEKLEDSWCPHSVQRSRAKSMDLTDKQSLLSKQSWGWGIGGSLWTETWGRLSEIYWCAYDSGKVEKGNFGYF